MIADTTFLSLLYDETQRRQRGAAMAFLARHRNEPILATVISAGEFAVILPDTNDARRFLANYRILRLHPEIAYTAAAVDRELIAAGARLGENDNWMPGFAATTGSRLSAGIGFDRVRGLRRVGY